MTNSKLFPEAEPSPYYPGLEDVTPLSLSSAKESKIQLIDVREPEEYTGDLGHIEGAMLIPLGELSERGPKEISPTEPVVFICRSGGRSSEAGIWALENGYQQVYNMKGGMIAWQEHGLKSVGS